ncbi:hypothetical protein AAC387_Pa05g3221 [Persea americana]
MDPDDIDAPLRVVAVRMEEGLINKISLFVTVNCVKPVGETEWKIYYHANPPNLLSELALEPLAIREFACPVLKDSCGHLHSKFKFILKDGRPSQFPSAYFAGTISQCSRISLIPLLVRGVILVLT